MQIPRFHTQVWYNVINKPVVKDPTLISDMHTITSTTRDTAKEIGMDMVGRLVEIILMVEPDKLMTFSLQATCSVTWHCRKVYIDTQVGTITGQKLSSVYLNISCAKVG